MNTQDWLLVGMIVAIATAVLFHLWWAPRLKGQQKRYKHRR